MILQLGSPDTSVADIMRINDFAPSPCDASLAQEALWEAGQYLPQSYDPQEPYKPFAAYEQQDGRGMCDTASQFFAVLILDPQEALSRTGNPKKSQLFPLAVLPSVLASLQGAKDAYLGQAIFTSPTRRTVGNVASIQVCFVDMDIYKTAYRFLHPTSQVWALLQYCEDIGIPAPSMVLFTGRGLLAKWLLDDPVHSSDLSQWRAVQYHLTEQLKTFGADMQARDPSRVFRIPGSINGKSEYRARYLWPRPFTRSLSRWDIGVLYEEVVPAGSVWRGAEGKEQDAVCKAKGLQPPGLRRCGSRQLWADRLSDIHTVLRLRGWHVNGAPRGHRDGFLFLASCALAYIVSAEDLMSGIHRLAKRIAPTWSPQRIHSCVSTVVRLAKEQDGSKGQRATGKGQGERRYKFSNKEIIERLDIKPGEQKHLKTLIGEDLASERHRARNRRGVSREEAAKQRAKSKAQAQRLRNEGLAYKDIGERMGISAKQVDNLLSR